MVVHFVRQNEKKEPTCADDTILNLIRPAFTAGDFLGKEGQTILFYPEPSGTKTQKGPKRVLIVGLGKDKPSREILRKAGGTVASTAAKTKTTTMLVVVPETEELKKSEMVECMTEGLLLGTYQFRKYKTTNEDQNDTPSTLEKIELSVAGTSSARHGLKLGQVAAEAGCKARDMANEPGSAWTPTHFAKYSLELSKQYGFRRKVLSLNNMKKMGMGGIIGVNQGSAEPPKMIILEYKTGRKKAPTLLLVGKGLTFDSGGISLKPGSGMQDMKYDMCGGAAVLAAMQMVGEEKPKRVNIVAIVPATDNMPGPHALKPGDIITHYNGKTVEVINTDAEGRLILADALSYGVDTFKPDAIVDLATLTGAVIIGLGHHRTGLLSNNDKLSEKILAAGERSGEPLWRLPLGPEYTKQLKSEIADIKNVGSKGAGTITAGAFLQEFVGETPWAHLDIAGTAWKYTEKSYIPKGPSGVGVRTLIELIRAWR
ncbi:MAG: leucyl aminopeptidase [Desulfobulbaceae bacterium]|nr:leucyl aminopeptidase [Desulfobulbaceae bacterium]